MSDTKHDVESAVRERYTAAARTRVDTLCCPVDYDKRYLEVIPDEILQRDYGCGDPSRHLRRGETVLDLGCGGGKICYIAAQVVGPTGRVIGIDINDEMLDLARRHQGRIGDALGYHNVIFRKGRIQDLALNADALAARLEQHPVRNAQELETLQEWIEHQRRERPFVADGSVDVVVSNCVLNLVREQDKQRMFREIHRVLAPGGRCVISDIVSDETVPAKLQADAELWSGCVSGALREDQFAEAFERAGLYGVQIVHRDSEPWRVVEGIEFRAMTVEAFKGKAGSCLERLQAVIYKGPWRSVTDDDGHTLQRGQRTAVCDKTFRLYTRAPYAQQIEPVPPRIEVPLADAAPFDCARDTVRLARETKGADYRVTRGSADGACGPGDDCC